jgi:hypothetical protein
LKGFEYDLEGLERRNKNKFILVNKNYNIMSLAQCKTLNLLLNNKLIKIMSFLKLK